MATSFNLGSFTEAGVNNGPWTVTVHWGDNTTSTFSTPVQGSLSQTHTYAASGDYSATVAVTDMAGASASAALPMKIAPPSATFSNGGPVNSGSAGTVSFANAIGGSGSYTYSYDFNNDGTFEIVNSTSPTASVPAQYLANQGSLVVRGRITDSSGTYTDYTTTIVVNSAAPVVTPGGPGQTAVQGETTNFGLGSFSDAGVNDGPWTLTVNWGDNTTSTYNTSFQAAMGESHAYGTSGVYTVTVSVTNSGGATGSASFGVTIVPPPSATFSTSGPVNEGSTGTVSFANATGGIGSYLYSYDFNNDGTFEVANSTSPTATVPPQYLASPGSLVVHGRITDMTGAFTDYTTAITIIDVPPTVTLAGPFSGTAGTAVSFAATVTSPSPAVTAAGFTYLWSFGDGTTSTLAAPTHVYAAAGSYTVTVAATDRYGGATMANSTATVSALTGGSLTSASFLRTDATTEGNWEGAYGGDGYNVVGDDNSYPAYAQVNITSAQTWTWAGSTSDVRALEKVSVPNDRIAGAWYSSSGPMTIDVNLTDSQQHIVALYFLDWDNGGRVEKVNVVDPTSGTVLDTRTVSNFADGTYLVWDLSGHVQLQINDAGGNNAVFGGIFFGPPGPTPPPPLAVRAPATLSGLQGVSATYGLGSFSDPNSNTGPWNVTVNWGDQSISQFTTNSPGTLIASHGYAAAGDYTATVMVTDALEARGSANIAFTVAAPTTPTDDTANFIVTPNDQIPNFGANPTIRDVHSGNWSNPTTWSTGVVPGPNDVVSIEVGTTVTFDTTSTVNTVIIQNTGSLVFRTDVNTSLTLVNLLELQGGTLQIGTQANPEAVGVKAQIVFADQPINTTTDPSQYGNGMIALGNVTMYGAYLPQTWIDLATPPQAGNTTLTLSQPATGWQVGDKLVLPDSRQLTNAQWPGNLPNATVNDETETPTIAGISADGKTITLTAPLQYSHPGAINGAGVLVFTPDVGDLNRNVVVHSANPNGTRGYVMFTGRANVNIQNAQFSGLGRTTSAVLDDTTYDANGNVTHVGTNQQDRYGVYFNHLYGPTSLPADGYQYTFVGNSVFCPITPMVFRWGIGINDSDYGLVSDNVVYNWNGAGIMAGLTGDESYNLISDNFVVKITGYGGDPGGDPRGRAFPDMGWEGTGIWMAGVNNYVVGNVVADAAQGYNYWETNVGSVPVPLAPGDDPWVAGQSQMMNMGALPLLEFSNNTAYGGAMRLGFWYWSLNISDYPVVHSTGAVSNVTNLHVWNVFQYAVYNYSGCFVTFEGFVGLDSFSELAQGVGAIAFYSSDYVGQGLTIDHSDIEGFEGGYAAAPIGIQTIQNTFMENYTDISVIPRLSLGEAQQLSGPNAQPYEIIANNDQFVSTGLPDMTNFFSAPPAYIDMSFPDNLWANLIASTPVMVYNFNGVQGDNFQVFFTQQAANFMLPQTAVDPDGTITLLGAPVAGLTNAQAWAQFGIAFGGEVAPSTATTMDGIIGLVNPI